MDKSIFWTKKQVLGSSYVPVIVLDAGEVADSDIWSLNLGVVEAKQIIEIKSPSA